MKINNCPGGQTRFLFDEYLLSKNLLAQKDLIVGIGPPVAGRISPDSLSTTPQAKNVLVAKFGQTYANLANLLSSTVFFRRISCLRNTTLRYFPFPTFATPHPSFLKRRQKRELRSRGAEGGPGGAAGKRGRRCAHPSKPAPSAKA